MNLRTGVEGVEQSEISADVINGSPLLGASKLIPLALPKGSAVESLNSLYGILISKLKLRGSAFALETVIK